MATLTMDDLVNAGFPQENFPEDLPSPGEETLEGTSLEGKKELWRYQASMPDGAYAMEVEVDRSTMENPAEAVSYMLNQFAYLWRMDREKIAQGDDGSCRRIVL